MKERLDVLLVERGLAESREKAKRSIMAGLVTVDGRLEDKPGSAFYVQSDIQISGSECPYVSRGGLKLQKALGKWGISLENAVCVDIGASTGGFTDCMLQHGAGRVYAVDVGYGQLDYRLRNDERVVNIERTNIRYLDIALIPEPADFISADVSFISLKHIFPVAAKLLAPDGKLICLVKPQFEAGREKVGRGGIIKDPATHEEVINAVISYARDCGFFPLALTCSPIKGAKGNIEYLLLLSPERCDNIIDVRGVVNSSHLSLR